MASDEESTILTRAFSGRPARGIRNAFIRQWDESGLEPLPFPSHNTITRDIRNAAAAQHNSDYMSLWAGQGTRLLKAGQSAEEIVAETVAQAKPADVILIAGKGHEDYQETAGVRRPFSDMQQAQAALARREHTL